MNEFSHETPVFIVGSPRSGTTVFGDILHCHEKIRQWYEPYFILDRHFRRARHDERTAAEALPVVRRQIRRDFQRYRQKIGADIIVDKSPRNSLKMPFLHAIFPQARFIHLLRDGRDATLSIHREWNRRRNIVLGVSGKNRFDYARAFQAMRQWLGRQPFFKDKVRALWFETHGQAWHKKKHLNRLRWNGEVGWGPRFQGWETVYARASLLQFNAAQWAACVDAILAYWDHLPPQQRIEIRYENLLTHHRETIRQVLDFLGVPARQTFFDAIPKLKTNNTGKWMSAFSTAQQLEIATFLTPTLKKTGYITDDDGDGRFPAADAHRSDQS